MQKITIRKKGIVGLDIGVHSIKVVEIQEWQGRRVLKNLGVEEIPVMHRKEGKRDIAFIAGLIRELFAVTGIKNRKVVLAISGPSVSFKVIKLPKMPESELREAIKWEMRRQMQFSIEDAVFDYSVLDMVMEGGIAKIKLLVAAAQRSAVDEQLDIIQKAGLQPEGMDVAPFAVWRAFEGKASALGGQRAPTEGETIVLIDIGYKRTSISLVRDNALQFSRDVAVGDNSLTEALLAPMTLEDIKISLTYDRAEELKRMYGIPPWDSPENTDENIPLSQVYVLMRPVLEKLLSEIGRSLDFFSSQLYVPKIDKIILSGGGTMVKGLPEFLTQELNVHVDVINPFQTLALTLPSSWGDVDNVWLSEMSPTFAVSVGLALPVPERIDLVPQEIRAKKQRLVYGTVLAVSSFILLLIFAAFYIRVSTQLSALQRELSARRSQLSAMVTPASKLPQLRELREKVKREKALLPKEPFERYPWTEMMKEISNAVPLKIMLTRLSVDTETPRSIIPPRVGGTTSPPGEGAVGESAMRSEKSLRLKGIIFGKDPEDRIGLNRFIRFMETSPLFTGMRLVSTHDTIEYEQAAKDFEFICIPVSESRKYNSGIANRE